MYRTIDDLSQSSCYRGRDIPFRPLPEAVRLVLAPFAPLLSPRVWLHAPLLLLGAILAPGARTITAALQAMGLATEGCFTNYHRVLNRATWSARQGGRILLGLLVVCLVPSGAPIILGSMTPWSAVADGRSPPGAAIAMRCALPVHTPAPHRPG
jgi:hypothetical protein